MAKSPSRRLDRPKAIEMLQRISHDPRLPKELKGKARRSMKVLQKLEERRQAKK